MKLRCTTTPHFQYWIEVNGFCDRHKNHIVDRIDKAIEVEVKKIAAEYELEELASVVDNERPQLGDLGEKVTVH